MIHARLSSAPGVLAGCLIVLVSTVPLQAQQQDGAPPPITAAVRSAVVDSLGKLLVRVYVDADTGRAIGSRVRDRLRAGAYDKLSHPQDFAQALTADLRSVNGDGHLLVAFAPGAPVDRLGPDTLEFAGDGGGEAAAAVEEQARGFHYGLGRLDLLTGNVGYAELTGFFDGENARGMMLAALEYLRDSDAIILDLRRHGGGSGTMSNWLLSHFVGPDSLLTLRIAERVNRRTIDRYTVADVPGPRITEAPVFILTSRATASAAEDIAFVLDNLGRAVIVGDRTAGAGHNNALLGLGHGFLASVSFSRVTDPATGREWERVGVAPDIAAPPAEALEAAHLAALDTLAARAEAPPRARRLALLRETAAALYDPLAVPAERLRAYAGRYGDREVTFTGEGLRYRRGQGPELPLVALTDSTFTLETAPAARLEFRGSGERAVLVVAQPDGRVVEVPREQH